MAIVRLRQVTLGLYRGSAPSPKDLQWLKDKLGIRKVVSLDAQSGERIARSCKLLGIHQIKAYIDGTRSSLVKFLHHNLKELLLEGGPTYVHCFHGRDRTGLVIAMFQCKYLNVSAEEAIKEAKSLGFGAGVPPKVVRLYEKLILNCKPIQQDQNSADIVSNEREYQGDNRDSYLDEARQDSFSPYLDHTRQAPADLVYNPLYEQSPTRQNYETYKNPKKYDEGEEVPLVGIYNNDAGMFGTGPVFPAGGFLSD